MVTFSQQIEDAIRVVQGKQAVFTATDVAEYAGLDGAEIRIAPVLQKHCGTGELLNLDGRHAPTRRYMRKVAAEKWWVNHTLRWAELGLNYLTPEQLAGAMSLAFGEPRWDEPPQNLLAVGRQWAMVDDGCVPGTYVSPWASVLRTHPHFVECFRIIFDFGASPYGYDTSLEETYLREDWKLVWDTAAGAQQPESFINVAVNEALDRLIARESEVLQRRLGLTTGISETLEQVGNDLGVSRERVRQIEARALGKLKAKPSVLFCGFAADFIRSGGALLMADSEFTPHRKMLSEIIELRLDRLPEFALNVIGGSSGISGYQAHLSEIINSYIRVGIDVADHPIFEPLQFLNKLEGTHLAAREQKHCKNEATKNRPLMVLHALRSLGRAAHYQEIRGECNRMFPQKTLALSPQICINALLEAECRELGVVQIGRHGMYGLKELGFSRPPRKLFDAIPAIVEARFAETGEPVSIDFVIAELSKERQLINRGSVLRVLGHSDLMKSAGGGRYIPQKRSSDASEGKDEDYDMDAGFEAL